MITLHSMMSLFGVLKIYRRAWAKREDISKPGSDFRSFFEQGGDSLSMVQLLSVLSDYGHHIGMTEFVLCQNLAEVVKGLNNGEAADEAATGMEGGDLSRVMEKLRWG